MLILSSGLMHKSLVPKLFIVVSLFISLPAKAEVSEIINPDWQAVPRTKPTAEIGGELGELGESTEPAFVNVNGITKNGDLLTYDMINPDFSYQRVEMNCKTSRYRRTRTGDFKSSTRVTYTSTPNPWEKVSDSYYRALYKFVCSR